MRVTVRGVPDWVPADRLLGEGFSHAGGAWVAELDPRAAADVDARLRGVGLGGALLNVEVEPPLKRHLVREARTLDARRRRGTTPGFERGEGHLDEEGRLSLTPERLAKELGQQAWEAGFRTVVDAGCGAGGNTVGFARAGLSVTAIERDAGRLELARKNLSWLGVKGVQLVRGAWPGVGPGSADLLFLDPPWGADWNRARTTLHDFPILADAVARRVDFRAIWAKVPPSFAPDTWAGSTAEAWFGRSEGDFRRVKFVLIRA